MLYEEARLFRRCGFVYVVVLWLMLLFLYHTKNFRLRRQSKFFRTIFSYFRVNWWCYSKNFQNSKVVASKGSYWSKIRSPPQHRTPSFPVNFPSFPVRRGLTGSDGEWRKMTGSWREVDGKLTGNDWKWREIANFSRQTGNNGKWLEMTGHWQEIDGKWREIDGKWRGSVLGGPKIRPGVTHPRE